jgi:histidinol-phosphate/aromatic aminotransferase/cobyric acid decarboxylase-like protein
VLVHVPTFPRYELEARLHGCSVVAVRSDPPWTIDADAIRAALATQRIAVAFLCTPNNPTGVTIANDDVRMLASGFAQTIFIVDEALGNPADDGAIALARSESNVVVLRTFSKAFGLAGLRVGYALGAPALLSIAERGRPPFNVAVPAEAGAIAALDDATFLARSYDRFGTEAATFSREIEGLRGFAIRGRYANMFLIEVLSTSTAACIDALAAQGLLVADAGCFGGLENHAAIRVSLRDRAANARLVNAMERLQ